jgi:hypothetical protein
MSFLHTSSFAMMSPFQTKMIETCQLHNSDMKKLVPILRGVPSPGSARLDAYNNTVKEDVKALPRRLRQSHLSTSNNICRTHKGLNPNLMNEVWSWVQHEFDTGIGKHVFPVLMANKLTAVEETQIRQLEPVLEMWRKDFTTDASAPPSRTPISGHSKWTYQPDQCPACLLARIGSSKKVLVALYAGMIGRFPLHKLMSRAVPLAELRPSKLNNAKSRRVRFVRYWIKACSDGDAMLHDAAELGILLKKMHKEWKCGHRARPSIYGGQFDSGRLSSGGSTDDPFSDSNRNTEGSDRPTPSSRRSSTRHASSRQHFNMVMDINNSCQPKDWSPLDPKLGPLPRSSNIPPLSPIEPLGFNLPANHFRDSSSSSHHLLDSSDSDSTLYPGDSISVAPLRITKPAPRPITHPYADIPSNPFLDVPRMPRPTSSMYSIHPSCVSGSIASSATILSYDGGEAAGLPMPKRQSMYFRYGDGMGDPFEEADEDAAEGMGTIGEEKEIEGKRDSVATTSWGALY